MDDDELAAILASAAAFDQSRERAMPVPAKRARDASRRVAEAALAARQQPSAAELAAAAHAREAAVREQALQTPIAENNIGFKLALKCGWTYVLRITPSVLVILWHF
jgi:hypothetical protein